MLPTIKNTSLLCLISILAIVSVTLTNCRKDKFITDSSAILAFSRDTILFDTVFTTIGSTTQYLKVYNSHQESILISEIKLNTGSPSNYRFNVDGVDGPLVRDIEILPNDSIWVFVEVTVDPGAGNADFVIEDLLQFTTNGTVQDVVLHAWGRDAFFHGGLNDCGNPISEILEEGAVWNDSKPHVVYGIVAVDSGRTLTINEGVEIYCHAKSGIYVYKGNILINGVLDNEVTIQGDRLEPEYANLPGQWGIQLDCPIETGIGPQIASIVRGGIWIYQSPASNIKYCNIRNGNIGIQVDTTGVDYLDNNAFSTTITNTKITNMAGTGLFCQGGTVKGENILVANCGASCAYFSIGGRYQMNNCTFANYWSEGTRTSPAFALNNYYEDVFENVHVRQLFNCQFNDCIMYGNSASITDFNEFVVDIHSTGADLQAYQFNYCLVDSDINTDADAHFVECKNGLAPSFCDPANENFRIGSSGGSALFAGSGALFPLTDITGFSFTLRVKGCYAWNQDDFTPCD